MADKEKKELTAEEKAANRIKVRDLLVIGLLVVAILYFGMHVAFGVIGFFVWLAGRFTGVA